MTSREGQGFKNRAKYIAHLRARGWSFDDAKFLVDHGQKTIVYAQMRFAVASRDLLDAILNALTRNKR